MHPLSPNLLFFKLSYNLVSCSTLCRAAAKLEIMSGVILEFSKSSYKYFRLGIKVTSRKNLSIEDTFEILISGTSKAN